MTIQSIHPKKNSHEVLETGVLTKKIDGTLHEFQIVVLTPDDLEEVLRVEKETLYSLEKVSQYHPGSRQIFQDSLEGKGLIVGCLVENQLIGFRSIWYPRDHQDNLGLEIGLQANQLSEVAHLERSCVLPEFRGNNLQIRMTRHAINLAKKNKYFRYIFSTVAPENYASMQDKFLADMVIVKLKKKYEGFYRYIFFQDIVEPISSQVNPSELNYVDGDDIDRQSEILSQNENCYVGFLLKSDNGVNKVGFGKVEKIVF